MEGQVQKYPFKINRQYVNPHVSYFLGNLTSSKEHMAYINSSETQKIFINKLNYSEIPKAEKVNQIQLDLEPLTDFSYINVFGQWLLVVLQVSQVRIYNETGTELIFQFQSAQGQVSYFKGICVMRCSDGAEAIGIGNSNSQVYFISKKGDKFEAQVGILFTSQQTEIQCLASQKEDSQLIGADDKGNLHFFMLNNMKDIGYIKKLEGDRPNVPITQMCIMNRKLKNKDQSNLLITGTYLGKIEIYCLNEYHKVASINSHLKLITTLDCSNDFNQIVSGSEDTYLNVWKMDSEKGVHLTISYRLADQIVMGSKFVDQNHIIISTLDSCELTILTQNK